MGKHHNADAPPLTELEMLEEEYRELHGPLDAEYEARRPGPGPGGEGANSPDPACAPDELARQRLKHFYQHVHRRAKAGAPRVALCLSGGGIRSATFGLGVLQGLAKYGLLEKFDYLSTVSGGGYVGGWLSAWIHRHPEGRVGVLRELAASAGGRAGDAAPDKENIAREGDTGGPEPDEVEHLREYSNYLTPRLGLLRPDSWTLVATYLRNLLLNWLVLIPLIALLLMVPRIYVAALFHFSFKEMPRWPGLTYGPGLQSPVWLDRYFWVWYATLAAVVVPSMVALVAIIVGLPSVGRVQPGQETSHPPPQEGCRFTQAYILGWVIVPLVVSCVAGSLWRGWIRTKRPPTVGEEVVFCAGYYLIAAAIALLIMYRTKKPNRPSTWRLLPVLVAAGTLCGVVAWASERAPLLNEPATAPAFYGCMGIPMFLGMNLVLLTLYVGLSSTEPGGDDDREYLARIMGWILMLAMIWMALAAVALYGPALLYDTELRLWRTWRFAAISVVSTVLGIVGGHSEISSARENRAPRAWKARILQWIPGAAARVAVAALLVLMAGGIDVLLGTYALHGAMFARRDARLPANLSTSFGVTLLVAVVLAGVVLLWGRVMNMNRLSLHAMYRDRLIRAFLGASNRGRKPDPFTGFDPTDNVPMHHLRRNALFSPHDFVEGPRGRAWHLDVVALADVIVRDEELRPCVPQQKRSQLNDLSEAIKGVKEKNRKPDTLIDPLVRLLNTLVGSPDLWSNLGYDRGDHGHDKTSKIDPEVRLAHDQLVQDGRPTLMNRLILEVKLSHLPKVPVSMRPTAPVGAGPAWTGEPNASVTSEPPTRQVIPLPLHVVNVALNLVDGKRLAWQSRKAASFTITPLHCGFAKGYRKAVEYGGSVTLGTAMTISGAAATPNMGYHSSPAVTFLMALLNVRLGWWLGNPATTERHSLLGRIWEHFGRKTEPAYRRRDPRHTLQPLINEALGRTNDGYQYVYLSDGGHFENLGLYEMVRRRCRYIVVCDATCDPKCQFDDLGNAVRKIQIDMGVPVKIKEILFYPKTRTVRQGRYCAVGDIDYAAVDGKDAEPGKLIYLKPARHEDEAIDVYNLGQTNEFFPHEPTVNQWFSEAQFESYRKLGLETVTSLCAGIASDGGGGDGRISLQQFLEAARKSATRSPETVDPARAKAVDAWRHAAEIWGNAADVWKQAGGGGAAPARPAAGGGADPPLPGPGPAGGPVVSPNGPGPAAPAAAVGADASGDQPRAHVATGAAVVEPEVGLPPEGVQELIGQLRDMLRKMGFPPRRGGGRNSVRKGHDPTSHQIKKDDGRPSSPSSSPVSNTDPNETCDEPLPSRKPDP